MPRVRHTLIVVCLLVLGVSATGMSCDAYTAAPTTTSATATGRTVVWAAGDLCLNSSSARCGAVARLVANDPDADAFLALGDNQYASGTLSEYRNTFAPKVDKVIGASRVYPVAGNHDYYTSNAAGYFDYFGSRAGTRGNGWYSKVLGGWRLVAANSNCYLMSGCGATSPQGKFIGAAVRDTAQKCEIVFAHHPAQSDGEHGGTNAGRSVFKLAYDNGADLYLAGHDHGYQRFAPAKPDGSLASNGVRSLVVGTGGAESSPWGHAKTSQYRQNSKPGAVRLVLGNGSYTGKFIAVDGTVMDTFSGTCH